MLSEGPESGDEIVMYIRASLKIQNVFFGHLNVYDRSIEKIKHTG